MQKCSLEFIFSGSAAPPSAASTLALYAVNSSMGLARHSLHPPCLQHSARYIILENNISSKLNMRKNMIVLTSDCDAASTVADIAPDTQPSHLTRPIITQS